jgi:peptidoglycan/xylan/chitin deacetylase (PgdA/CDA1 family)
MTSPRLALKLDVDTFEGTVRGVPRLLDLFAKKKVPASIYFSLGPDNSGKAIRRIWERPGFLAKMRRTKAASTYGLRTVLSGTLLPARDIGPAAAPLLRRAEGEGHEVALHAWDHVEWHDRLPRWDAPRIRADFARSFELFEKALGRKPRAVAAPGWTVSATSLEVQDELSLLYASDGRGREPFFPRSGGRTFRTLQIPTTLPTWDEMLGRIETVAELEGLYRLWIRESDLSVHTIHAEVEGGIHHDLFARCLDGWLEDGVGFVTLEQIAKERLGKRDGIPVIDFSMGEIPGRAGEVALAGEARPGQ